MTTTSGRGGFAQGVHLGRFFHPFRGRLRCRLVGLIVVSRWLSGPRSPDRVRLAFLIVSGLAFLIVSGLAFLIVSGLVLRIVSGLVLLHIDLYIPMSK
jgi:hypothetical protein